METEKIFCDVEYCKYFVNGECTKSVEMPNFELCPNYYVRGRGHVVEHFIVKLDGELEPYIRQNDEEKDE